MVENNAKDMTPFVLSILSIILIGPIGLVLAIVALVLTSKEMSLGFCTNLLTAAQVIGIIGVVLSSLFTLLLLYLFGIFALIMQLVLVC